MINFSIFYLALQSLLNVLDGSQVPSRKVIKKRPRLEYGDGSEQTKRPFRRKYLECDLKMHLVVKV
jgi:hypothetical protein